MLFSLEQLKKKKKKNTNKSLQLLSIRLLNFMLYNMSNIFIMYCQVKEKINKATMNCLGVICFFRKNDSILFKNEVNHSVHKK